ncbi:hypothetical protein AAG570_004279 [Ranatra chinensis]|uniref:Reverse transcriptase n=1 Tax=Ranatra chinensis TaxID=642074 RepID=A0ABD0Y0G5_9HEMI
MPANVRRAQVKSANGSSRDARVTTLAVDSSSRCLRGIHSLSQVLNDLSSDHSPVLLTTSLDPILELPPPILTPGHTDWNYFAQSLDSVIDLRVPLKTPEDLDEAVQEFTLAVQRTARTSSQPPTPKYNTKSINLPQHIRLLITHKRRARSKWQRTRYPSDRQHYEQLAHELRSELSSFRSDTYNSYIISLSTHDRSLWDSTKRLFVGLLSWTLNKRLIAFGIQDCSTSSIKFFLLGRILSAEDGDLPKPVRTNELKARDDRPW